MIFEQALVLEAPDEQSVVLFECGSSLHLALFILATCILLFFLFLPLSLRLLVEVTQDLDFLIVWRYWSIKVINVPVVNPLNSIEFMLLLFYLIVSLV